MEESSSNKSDAAPKKCYCSPLEEQRSDRSSQKCNVGHDHRSTSRSQTPVSHLIPRNARVNTDDLREVAHFLRSTGPLDSTDFDVEGCRDPVLRKKKISAFGLPRISRPKGFPTQKSKQSVAFVASGPTLVPRVSSSGIHYIEIISPHSKPCQGTHRRTSTDLAKIKCNRKSIVEEAQPFSPMKVETMAAPPSGGTLPQVTFSGYDSALADDAINTYISSLQMPDYGEYTTKDPCQPREGKKKPAAINENTSSNAKLPDFKNESRMAELRFGFDQKPSAGKGDWRGENTDKPLPSLPGSICQSPRELLPNRSCCNSPTLDGHPFTVNINQRSLNTLSTFIPQDGLKSAHLRLNATIANQQGLPGTCTPDLVRSTNSNNNSNKIQPTPKPGPAIQQSFAARRANARTRKLRDLERLRESIDDIRQMPDELHSPSIESVDPFNAPSRPAVRPSKTMNNVNASACAHQPGLKKARESVSMPSIEKLDLSPMPLMNERFPAPATTKPAYGKGTSSFRLTTTAPATPPPSRPVPPLPDEAREHHHTATTSTSTPAATTKTAPSLRQPSPTDHLSLEDRLQHTERENRLLEAALMAMLRTNGLLNGCACCSSSSPSSYQLGPSRFSTSSSTANTLASSAHTRHVSEDTTTDSTAIAAAAGLSGTSSSTANLRTSQDTTASSVSSARTGCSSKALDAYLRTRVDFVRSPTPSAGARPASSSRDSSGGGTVATINSGSTANSGTTTIDSSDSGDVATFTTALDNSESNAQVQSGA